MQFKIITTCNTMNKKKEQMHLLHYIFYDYQHESNSNDICSCSLRITGCFRDWMMDRYKGILLILNLYKRALIMMTWYSIRILYYYYCRSYYYCRNLVLFIKLSFFHHRIFLSDSILPVSVQCYLFWWWKRGFVKFLHVSDVEF